jgi:hypothetical protein
MNVSMVAPHCHQMCEPHLSVTPQISLPNELFTEFKQKAYLQTPKSMSTCFMVPQTLSYFSTTQNRQSKFWAGTVQPFTKDRLANLQPQRTSSEFYNGVGGSTRWSECKSCLVCTMHVKNSELRKYSTVLSRFLPTFIKKLSSQYWCCYGFSYSFNTSGKEAILDWESWGVLPVLCVIYLYANSSCELDQLLFCEFLRW